MKKKSPTIRSASAMGMTAKVCLVMCAVALMWSMTGCATTGYQKAAQTAQSLADTRASLTAADYQVVQAINTLDKMLSTPGVDLQVLYKQFSKNVAAIKSQAEDAKWRADSYRQDANAYLDQWSQELAGMNDAGIRLQSAARRQQVLGEFQVIERSAAATRQAYYPLIKELDNIQQSLGQDLTASGLTVIAQPVKVARTKAKALRSAIRALENTLNAVARNLSSGN